MSRFVMYNGKGGVEPSASKLEKGKRYEVVSITLENTKIVTLKGVEGTFNYNWFDDCDEGVVLDTKVMKPAYLARLTTYRKNFESCVGTCLILKKANKRGNFKETTTSPIKKIENIYGNIYKVETENSIYITEVNIRAVV